MYYIYHHILLFRCHLIVRRKTKAPTEQIRSDINPASGNICIRPAAAVALRHQLSYAGTQSDIFTEKAIDSIFSYSAGVARVIDKVCTNVLIYGCQNRLRLIDDHAVNVVLECEFS